MVNKRILPRFFYYVYPERLELTGTFWKADGKLHSSIKLQETGYLWC